MFETIPCAVSIQSKDLPLLYTQVEGRKSGKLIRVGPKATTHVHTHNHMHCINVSHLQIAACMHMYNAAQFLTAIENAII